jgi:hypothetical protein
VKTRILIMVKGHRERPIQDDDDSSKAESCKDSEAEGDCARMNDGKDDDFKDNSKDNS